MLKKKLPSGAYNASAGNLSASDTANEIKKIIRDCKIIIKKSNDPRSYRLSNEKLVSAGFNFKINLKEGISNFIENYQNGKILNNKNAYSINFINQIKFK